MANVTDRALATLGMADTAMSGVTTLNLLILGGAIVTSLGLLDFILTPHMHPNEPPLLKPSIPLIGHLIGLILHQTDYHRIVR